MSSELLRRAKTPQQVVYCLRGMGAYAHFKKWPNGTIHVWAKRRPFRKSYAKTDVFLWGEVTKILVKEFDFEFHHSLAMWHGIYSLTLHKWISPNPKVN